jgi:NADH oxidase (H2O-forming)
LPKSEKKETMDKTDNKVIDITKDVKWVGVLDYDIKTFDIVMQTDFGTTYNSYFINADRKAIVEVAKEKFSGTYLDKIREVTDPKEIQYIILDHTEPDHSGSLKLLLDLAPEATVVGSGNAIRYLEDMVNGPFKSMVVKDGDTLDLGNKTLRFFSAPNLHWPDSIYTLLVEDRVLFTCDSFGAHFCSPGMYSEFAPDYTQSFKYYFDVILKPFSRHILKAIEKIKPLEFDYICTGHGPVHTGKNKVKAIELTEAYAREYMKIIGEKQESNILIAYVSAYGYTRSAAGHIASGMAGMDRIKVDVVDIETIPLDELESRLISADAILVGSPTINQNTLLPVYKLFALINPIRDKGKLCAAFGSYGWSGESPRIIAENFRLLKLRLFEEPAAFKFSPEGSKEENLKEFGRRFAEKLLSECGPIKNPGN